MTNTGGIFKWAVSDAASWLDVSPASGSGSRTFRTKVNTAGLTAGTFNGTLTVSAMDDESLPSNEVSKGKAGAMVRAINLIVFFANLITGPWI